MNMKKKKWDLKSHWGPTCVCCLDFLVPFYFILVCVAMNPRDLFWPFLSFKRCIWMKCLIAPYIRVYYRKTMKIHVNAFWIAVKNKFLEHLLFMTDQNTSSQNKLSLIRQWRHLIALNFTIVGLYSSSFLPAARFCRVYSVHCFSSRRLTLKFNFIFNETIMLVGSGRTNRFFFQLPSNICTWSCALVRLSLKQNFGLSRKNINTLITSIHFYPVDCGIYFNLDSSQD